MRGGHRLRPLGTKSTASTWGWIVTGILLVLGVGALWWLLGLPGSSRTPRDIAERGGDIPLGEDLGLWFASRQEDALVLERRRVPPNQSTIDRVKVSLQELIAGPQSAALRTVPAELKVREVFMDDQGTAYIDFSEALSQSHPGGPWAEMLTLRSIMQTLVTNVPEIKRVQILIEGREVETLAGHIDIRQPLDTSWIINHR